MVVPIPVSNRPCHTGGLARQNPFSVDDFKLSSGTLRVARALVESSPPRVVKPATPFLWKVETLLRNISVDQFTALAHGRDLC